MFYIEPNERLNLVDLLTYTPNIVNTSTLCLLTEYDKELMINCYGKFSITYSNTINNLIIALEIYGRYLKLIRDRNICEYEYDYFICYRLASLYIGNSYPEFYEIFDNNIDFLIKREKEILETLNYNVYNIKLTSSIKRIFAKLDNDVDLILQYIENYPSELYCKDQSLWFIENFN